MKKLVLGIMILALLVGCSQAGQKPTPTATPGATTKKTSGSGASAQGYVTPIRRADLAFRSGGRVVEVLVKEGDAVKAGQPLVKLQDTELKAALALAQADLKGLQKGARAEEIAQAEANLKVAQAQVESAQAELAKLQAGVLAAQVAAVQADVARSAAELKVAQDGYDALVLGPGHGVQDDVGAPGRGLGQYEENKRARLAALKASYDAAQRRLTEARANVGDTTQSAQAGVDIATAQRDATQARLNLIKVGTTPQQIEAAKARVAQMQASLDEAVLLAPLDGTVAELDIQAGESASPGVRVASLADLTQWQVETDDLSEVDVVGVQPGADVSVTVDALPGVTLKGKVTSITPRSAVKRGDVTYTVKVAIVEPDSRLKWGMTAFVEMRDK